MLPAIRPASYGAIRFVEGFSRIDVTHSTGLNGSQWTALVVGAASLLGLAVVARLPSPVGRRPRGSRARGVDRATCGAGSEGKERACGLTGTRGVGDGPDVVAWTYAGELRREGEPVRDLIAFFDDRVDLRVDP